MSLTVKRKREPGDGFTPTRDQTNLMKVESTDNKKSRLDHGTLHPSFVVHVRNLPSDVTEHEVAILAIPFGIIKNMVLARKTCQALIEMDLLEDAINLIDYYDSHPVMLHGKAIVLQFSTHSHLEVATENAAMENAVRNANRIVEQDLVGCASGTPHTVLRIIIDNVMGQQINHLILYKIFHRFGKIFRVIIFLRNNQYHCMLEFENHTQAFVAMLHLNGQNIYTGCCSLRVEFSRSPAPLQVRRETDKCRDYVVTPLTSTELNRIHSLPSGNASGTSTSALPSPHSHSMCLQPAPPPQSTVGVNDLAAQLVMLAQQSGLTLTPQAAAVTAGLMTLSAQGGSANPPLVQQNSVLAGGADRQTPIASLPGLSTGPQSSNNVLIVSNLNEQLVHPDALFTLFGVYGDVTRVKVMFNKKNTALVQFADGQQAQTAMYYLNGQPLWGKTLKISISKFNVVQLPKEDTDIGLTKDYTNHTLHRFRKPNSKNFSNIYAPSNTLHLSNIPQDVEEQEIRNLFQSRGYPVSGLKFVKFGEKKMAFVQLDSIDVAIQALVELHNIQLSDNSHVRISFSKSAI